MIPKTEEGWKKKLTSEQYHILRKSGTEAPFTGKHWNNHKKGVFTCAGCGEKLFSSKSKFDSGTGWPSFFEPMKKESVDYKEDRKFFMKRTEVHCKKCKGHLGHVFNDGPKPTGKRYCINSACLDFKEEK